MESNRIKEIKSKRYIQSLIEEGENEHQDFKFQISDARKIARSVSAFANNAGGHLLVGVKDNGRVTGVSSDEEIYMIEQAATMYCSPAQQVKCNVYRVEGKAVLKVDIAPAAEPPVMAQDNDGSWTAYYRVADENMIADPLQIALWESRRGSKPAALTFTESERTLIDYITRNGSVTLQRYMLMAHITQPTAQASVVSLCLMGTLSLRYQEGQCVIVLAQGKDGVD